MSERAALAETGATDRAGARPAAPAGTGFTPEPSQRPVTTHPAAATGPSDSTLRPNWLAAAPLLALNIILTWLGRAPGITTRQDDAVYLMLARALRTGAGYVELFTPGHPAHTQYPPVYPAVLAAVSAVFGERIDLLLALNVLFVAGALAVFYGFAARRWRPIIALAALGLAAINPAIDFFTGNLLSEPLFTFLLFATCAIALRERQSSWSLVAIGLLAIAAAFTRTAGLTLVLAVGITWLLERRWVAAAALAVFGGGLGGVWLARAAHAPVMVPGRSYIADAVAGASRSHLGLVGIVAGRVLSNGKDYLSAVIPWVLPAPTIRGTSIDNVLCMLLLLVCGALGFRELWRKARFVAVFLVCYGLLLLAWTWPVDRFLIPILPLLLLTLLVGAYEATRRLSGWRAVVLIGFVAIAIAFAAGVRNADFLARARGCDRESATTSSACYDADQIAFFESARAVGRLAPASAIVASQKPATFYYYSSGHEVVPLEVALQASPRGFFSYLQSMNVSYLVLEHTVEGSTRVAERLASGCDHLRIAHAAPPMTLVFALEPQSSPADSRAACAAVAAYRANQSHWLEQIW